MPNSLGPKSGLSSGAAVRPIDQAGMSNQPKLDWPVVSVHGICAKPIIESGATFPARSIRGNSIGLLTEAADSVPSVSGSGRHGRSDRNSEIRFWQR